MPQYSDAIGIDFGTVRSYVGVWNLDSRKVEILATNSTGNTREFPSYVHFTGKNVYIAGHEAKAKFSDPNTCLLGVTTIGDARKLLPEDIPFELVDSNGPEYLYFPNRANDPEALGVTISPTEIAVIILKELKKIAEKHTKHTITKVVITVPAESGINQRKAFEKAGKDADFGTVDIFEDPTASAIAYTTQETTSPGKLLVFDLGNSSLDISILESTKGKLGVKGNKSIAIGGATFDEDILNLVNEKYRGMTSQDLDADTKRNLRLICAEAKKALGSESTTNIPVGQHIIKLTRQEFDNTLVPHIEKMRDGISSVLQSAGMNKRDISRVLLVGGSSRIPNIKVFVTEIFGAQKIVSWSLIDPDETVVYGATMHAAKKADDLEDQDSPDIIEQVAQSIGLRTGGGVMSKIIYASDPFPKKVTRMIKTSRDDQEVVYIRVYEGEDDWAANNQLIGEFKIPDIPKGPRRKLDISITYAINDKGILEVFATDDKGADRGKITPLRVHPL